MTWLFASSITIKAISIRWNSRLISNDDHFYSFRVLSLFRNKLVNLYANEIINMEKCI